MITIVGGSQKRTVLLTIALGLLVAGCGGGGGGGSTTTSTSTGTTTPVISNTDASTFMIGITKQNQQGASVTFLLGTGFAISDNLIATNAHVTKGVLETARELAKTGQRITAVTAFQSETGRSFPLLTAVVHPSYANDTRSPDVGLFVSREVLSAKLTLDDPQATTRLRKGDPLQINGFPGDLFNFVYQNFQPGLSVPKASLLSCNIQTISAFDTRKVVDPSNLATIEMYEHGCDTSGGTSGSPILNSGKVVGLHNAGLTTRFTATNQAGQQEFFQVPTATGSWGVHVKHLINLVNFYNTGVLEADKNFSLPPSNALINAQPGQTAGAGAVGTVFRGTVSNPSNSNVTHQIQLSIAQNLAVTGTTSWPANPSLNLAARTFTLQGTAQADGRLEVRDNTPEVIAGFRRGTYTGIINPANGVFTGQYYELNASTNELFYFGDWTAAR